MKNVIFLNGQYVVNEDAVVSTSDPGFMYGWGVFETMCSIRGKIVYLRAHIDRLNCSCRLLHIKIPYSSDKVQRIIREIVLLNELSDARVRLSVWKGQDKAWILVRADKYKPFSSIQYRRGFRLCVASLRQNEDSFLTRVKSMNNLLYQLSYHKAKDAGFDEALLLNSRGYIAECSRSNIFMVKDGGLFTPSLECGCLCGITRMALLDLASKYKIKSCEGKFTIADLKTADEAFITNSLMGIMPVAYLENSKIGRSSKITHFLSDKYSRL